MSTEKSAASDTSVLFQSDHGNVVLVDIPRTLEEAQVLPGETPTRRIFSEQPPDEPFETPEPKHGFSSLQSPAAQVADLMIGATVQDALNQLHDTYNGPYFAPRLEKRPASQDAEPKASDTGALITLPQDAQYLLGSVQEHTGDILRTAPKFALIVLDPPWPNRSARRKTKGYQTVRTLEDARTLLASIPVSSRLTESGLVAVWITNKHSIVDLMTGPAGIFSYWGVELVTEWTWLKVTAQGDPIYAMESQWRKSWERLLIAKRVGTCPREVPKPKVIVAAPDVHSRKPNLRGLFRDILGSGFSGLEVFARNLTAGWWSWGDEALKFQHAEYWNDSITSLEAS